MKNFSKTIASLSLSLLTIGAVAQIEGISMPIHPRMPTLRKAIGVNQIHVPLIRQNKIGTNPASIQMAYWVDDAEIVGQNVYSITGISNSSDTYYVDQINSRFDLNDSGTVTKNYNLITNAVVAFDTLVDQSVNFYSAAPGSMVVDTLWAACWYKNTSNTNDTLVFTIDSVSPAGYPTTKAYDSIIIPLYKGVIFDYATPSGTTADTVFGGSLDTGFTAIGIPNFALPNNHTKFSVNVTFLGSKADTLEVGFGFPFAQCNTTYYADAFTPIGNTFTSKAPRTINVNSYAQGWRFYYTSNVLLPSTDGTIFDDNNFPYNYEWNVCGAGGSGDTMFLYQQDYAIYSSVTFNDVTGINNITASGLSVGQNYPNPYNKQTQIAYSLTKSSTVIFTVYDITGRVIMTDNYNTVAPGQHEINLSADSFSPGIYFYTFNVNGSTITKKMVVTE